MENHHAINGKIHYKWPFSIAMLVYQRVTETKTTHAKGTASPIGWCSRSLVRLPSSSSLQSQCPTSKSSEATIYTTAIITVTVFPTFSSESQLFPVNHSSVFWRTSLPSCLHLPVVWIKDVIHMVQALQRSSPWSKPSPIFGHKMAMDGINMIKHVSPNDRFMIGLWMFMALGESNITLISFIIHLFSQETHCPQCSEETPPLRTNASGLFASTNSPQRRIALASAVMSSGFCMELNWGYRKVLEHTSISKHYRLHYYK